MAEPVIEKSIFKTQINTEKKETGFYPALLQKLEKYQKKTVRDLKRKHKKALKWLSKQGYDLGKVKKQAVKAIATGVLTTTILTATAAPIVAMSTPNILSTVKEDEQVTKQKAIVGVDELLARKRHKLSPQDERAVAHLISTVTGVNATPELDGHQLRQISGRIATEQHMPVYPGQTLNDQLQSSSEKEQFGWAGMTAHPSAWGYFADTKDNASEELIQNEKYYFAVQTFLIPNWSSSWKKEKEWYKFRKVLAYNPQTGKAVIGVIGDAGPAMSTGRQFGGSPEIMHELGLGKDKKLGEAVLLFVDDKDNQISLGPVNYQPAELAQN